MNTAEIKNNLHKLIVETDDVAILTKIQTFFIQLKSRKIDWWDMLTDQEKKLIDKGTNQLESGKGIPHKVVRKKVKDLFNKHE